MSRADNSLKIWWNFPINNSKPDLHNINAHTKFGENPLMFSQVIIQKWKTDGQTYKWRTDRHMDVQCEIIIPRHYLVAGYKNYSVSKRQAKIWVKVTLKFEQVSVFTCWCVLKLLVWVANNVESDQMLHSAASDLDLHCLLRTVCPNILGYYVNQ